MRVGSLESVHRYPVKSMAGESIDEAFVGFSGVMGDRVFAFTRTGGTEGFPWLTCRELEEMLLFKPSFDKEEQGPAPVHLKQSFDLAPGVNPVFPARNAFDLKVALPDGRALAIESPELAEEIARKSGEAVELRFSERSLYDCRPISIFGNRSAQELGKQLDMNIDRRRFRANFYVNWDNEKPFFENELVGKTLQIGSRLQVAIVDRDPRCKVITLDPETTEATPRVLRHITAEHEGFAGVYGAVLLEGVVKAGDPIHLV
jgi:uncharacterized protein YcbX